MQYVHENIHSFTLITTFISSLYLYLSISVSPVSISLSRPIRYLGDSIIYTCWSCSFFSEVSVIWKIVPEQFMYVCFDTIRHSGDISYHVWMNTHDWRFGKHQEVRLIQYLSILQNLISHKTLHFFFFAMCVFHDSNYHGCMKNWPSISCTGRDSKYFLLVIVICPLLT